MERTLRALVVGIAALAAAPIAVARVPDAPPVAVGDVPVGTRASWTWVSTGPPSVADLADVTWSADREYAAVIDREGSVWLARGAGTWRRVLAPIDASSGGTTGLEAVLDEVDLEDVEDLDLDIPDGDPEAALEALQDALDEQAAAMDDAARAREEAINEGAIRAEGGGVGGIVVAPRVWFTSDGLLVVGRSDGLWWSDNLGVRWTHALDEPVHALVLGPDGWVVGTDDGVLRVDDLRSFAGARRDLRGVRVFDLAVDWTGLHAATTDGWRRSEDGHYWAIARPGTTLSVATDPSKRRVWIGTPGGVLAYNTDGAAVSTRPGGPRAVTSLAVLASGHLVAGGLDGPWATQDDGVTWVPIDRGLMDRHVSSVIAIDGVLWQAGAEGLGRLEPDDHVASGEPDAWVDISTLIDAAMKRPGIREIPLGNRLVAGMMPEVTVRVQDASNEGLTYRLGSGTVHNRDTDADWNVTLTWRPERQRRSVDFDPFLDDSTLNDPAAVVEYKIARGEYSFDVAREVRDLYHARQGLVLERPATARGPLLDRVMLELQVQEAEARLDLLTEGAVTRHVRAMEM